MSKFLQAIKTIRRLLGTSLFKIKNYSKNLKPFFLHSFKPLYTQRTIKRDEITNTIDTIKKNNICIGLRQLIISIDLYKYYFINTNSTRRFSALPSSELLLATGEIGPIPMACNVFATLPWVFK